MKRGDIVEAVVERIDFPNKGICRCIDSSDENNMEETSHQKEAVYIMVKNVLPGQRIQCRISKKRSGKLEGRLIEVLEVSSMEDIDGVRNCCIHSKECGGCLYQGVTYENQLLIKEQQIKQLFIPVLTEDGLNHIFHDILPSPKQQAYRNKMEFSFGDSYFGGPLSLGMHKRGSFYDIITTAQCQIMHSDMQIVLQATLKYFTEKSLDFYHKMKHTGYLRHLLVRRSDTTGEMMVDLITSTQIAAEIEQDILEGWKEVLLEQSYEGTLTGILHTHNDREADVVENQGMNILYGRDYIMEEILGFQFKISVFSFFQTNSFGAEVLYYTIRQMIQKKYAGGAGGVIYDLYSGTGTIAQLLSPVATKVVGIEIVKEAVDAAKENAKLNQIINCDFIAGDVLEKLDEIEVKPDFIVLDPPRDGVHPKALKKIIEYGVDSMIYIACKPTSLVRDMEILMQKGYVPTDMTCVDMFPFTPNIEVVVMFSRDKI